MLPRRRKQVKFPFLLIRKIGVHFMVAMKLKNKNRGKAEREKDLRSGSSKRRQVRWVASGGNWCTVAERFCLGFGFSLISAFTCKRQFLAYAVSQNLF
jgi:hypothetical protein